MAGSEGGCGGVCPGKAPWGPAQLQSGSLSRGVGARHCFLVCPIRAVTFHAVEAAGRICQEWLESQGSRRGVVLGGCGVLETDFNSSQDPISKSSVILQVSC